MLKPNVDVNNEVSDNINRANLLFDGHYILKAYGKKILARLSDCKKIVGIEVIEHKNQIWETTYHVVVEYKISCLTSDGKNKNFSLFCSAHSSEPRKNVYDSLKFLWNNGFNDSNKQGLAVPHPLFYSKYFRGTFYVGVNGHNLYHYIKNKSFANIEAVVRQAAVWFAKLHSLPTTGIKNFNRDNSRIQTVRPGMKNIFNRIESSYPQYYDRFKELYERVNRHEKNFLTSTEQRWLIHGDAHPENIIKIDNLRVAVIDFTDLSLSDFARDLGSFLQQVEFKIMRRIGDIEYAKKIKRLFLDSYLENAKMQLTDNLQQRIDNYYTWTALRTIAFFLTKHHPMPERAEQLLNSLK